MNDNKFPANNDNKAAPTEKKPKSRLKVFAVLTFVFAGVMAVGIILILFGMKLGSDSDPESKKTLNISLYIATIGAVMMMLMLFMTVVSAIMEKTKKNTGTAVGTAREQYVVDPAVLSDPRVKQLPEVQRLLQYSSVQQVFFDGKFPTTPSQLGNVRLEGMLSGLSQYLPMQYDDPHLQELAEVLSKFAEENGVMKQ